MTILETIPIMARPGNYDWMIIEGILGTFLFLLLSLFLYEHDYDIAGSILLILAICELLFFGLGIAMASMEPKIDTGRKQYIIRVNEDTSINDIYDHYKIIDHTKYTDVYTVEELEND